MLKRPDILVLLALVGRPRDAWDYAWLADQLEMSLSSAHRSVSRLAAAGLYSQELELVKPANAHEFLVHAVKYIAPLSEGPVATGVPTGATAEPLVRELGQVDPGALDAHQVWPSPAGSARGTSVEPIAPVAPRLVQTAPALYHRLTVLDVLRGGRARERAAAEAWMRRELELP